MVKGYCRCRTTDIGQPKVEGEHVDVRAAWFQLFVVLSPILLHMNVCVSMYECYQHLSS